MDVRRTGAVVVVIVVVVSTIMLVSARRTADVTARVDPRPSGPEVAAPEPQAAMHPAWLAWIAGSLPETLASTARREPALGTTVVVAGDTRWLTSSRDADGTPVDRPDPPYRIPIDAFAVSPGAYAPFVATDRREEVTRALRRGFAVLGESSAALRRLGPAGTLSFGPVDVEVGAVVPDEVVGFAEMLVSRAVGRRLGITHERYLLSIADGPQTIRRFEVAVSGLLPPGTEIQTVAPGQTPFVRIASGVNPPVVTKTIFGEFSAYPQPGNEAFLSIDPAWVKANIRTRVVPLLGRVTCHRILLGPLVGVLEEVQAAGLGTAIKVYSGCWAARTVQRSPTAPPSQHAYGAAIDINAPQSPFGSPPNFDLAVVRIFEQRGFNWGGDFLIPDGHHFEWWGDLPLTDTA